MDRTRQFVLSCTSRLLALEGAEAITFSRVSQESRVARSTLYRHWKSRDDLLCAAALPGFSVDEFDDEADIRALLVSFLTQIGAALVRSETLAAFAHALDASTTDAAVSQNFQSVAAAFSRVLGDRVGSRIGVDLAQIVGPVFFRALVLHQPTDGATVQRWVDALLAGSDPVPTGRTVD